MAEVPHLSSISAWLVLSLPFLTPLCRLSCIPQWSNNLKGINGALDSMNPGSGDLLSLSDPTAQLSPTVLCQGGCQDSQWSPNLKGEPQYPAVPEDSVFTRMQTSQSSLPAKNILYFT